MVNIQYIDPMGYSSPLDVQLLAHKKPLTEFLDGVTDSLQQHGEDRVQ